MDTIPQHQHPYYPTDVPISHYVPNSLPVPLLLASLGGMVASIVLAVNMLALRLNRSLTRSDLATLSWLVLCTFLHCFFEGYFVVQHATLASSRSLFAQLWKEYALSDSRYLTSEPFVLSVEGLTATFCGPLSLLCALSIVFPRRLARLGRLRHPMQLAVSIGQLYGVTLYWLTGSLESPDFFSDGGRPLRCRPEPFYFWVYYVACNLPWLFIPLLLIADSSKTISRQLSGLDTVSGMVRDMMPGGAQAEGLRETKKDK